MPKIVGIDYENGEQTAVYVETADGVKKFVAERKRGEWRIVERAKVSGTVIVECSECDAIFEISMIAFGLNYNFCPNCGALT